MDELEPPDDMGRWIDEYPSLDPVLRAVARAELAGYRLDLAVNPWFLRVAQETLASFPLPADGIAGRAQSSSVQLDRQAFALLLMWLTLLTLPAVQVFLPDDAQTMLNSYCGAIARALAVQWRMSDKRKD